VTIDLATATVTAAGHYNITASFESSTAAATLDAMLDDFTLGTGFDPNDQSKLDGAATAAAPSIAYPLAGSLFPVNVAADRGAGTEVRSGADPRRASTSRRARC